MQVLITHGHSGRTLTLQFTRLRLALLAAGLAVAVLLGSGLVYHFVFLTAAREGWPVVSQIVRLVVRDEIAQRDRFMRENLDAIAERVGQMQAKLVKLEAVGDRISGMAGVKREEIEPLRRQPRGGQGGPYLPVRDITASELSRIVGELDARADSFADVFTLIESRLLEARLLALLVPSTAPVDGPVGSGFGVRADPITGQPALHTGLDFPSEVGTSIMAAAGGVVTSTEPHPAYGHLVEIDHGSGLTTRYAHASRVLVKAGDIVKRGQPIAEVGTSGRTTGAHLHFEVLVDGVPQNPARFLAGHAAAPGAGRSVGAR